MVGAVTTPKVTDADGDGVPEEEGYVAEAEAIAQSIYDGLDDEVGGVEPVPEEPGDSSLSQESGSPADTTEVSAEKAEDVPTEVVGTTPEAKPEVAAEAAPSAEVKVEAGQQQVDPAAAATAQAQAAAATASGAAVGGTDLIQQVRQEIDKSRDVFTEALTQHYAMSEEDASAVLTEPEKVLPQLAARVHLEVVQNVLGTIAQTMPAVVTGILEAQKQQTGLVDQFFEKWPTLDRGSDLGPVMELGRIWRQHNLQGTPEEFIQKVGAMAVVQLGKLPAGGSAQPVGAVAPQKAAAYQPAARAPSPVQPQPAPNPWEAMAEMLDE